MPIDEKEEEYLRAHRQHAIPQHIGAFQFKLVGQLTIRQFGYIGGFGVLAWIVIASGLPTIIRWPAASAVFATGAAFAFISVAGRPLDKMLVNFFRAITTPTQRVWTKKGSLPSFFQPEFGKPKVTKPATAPQPSRKALEEYLAQFKTLPTQADLAEAAFISRLDFGVSLPAKVTQASQKQVVPQPKIEEVTLAGITVEERQPIKKAAVPIASSVNFVERPVITIPSPRPASQPPTFLPSIGEVKVRKLKSQPNLLVDFTVKIAGEKKFEISPELKQRLGLEAQDLNLEGKTKAEVSTKDFKKQKNGNLKQEVVAPKTAAVPPLAPPTVPNIISGIVKDNKGHLLEGVILIVKNDQGAPVRALKTNLLGQFSISTPLPNGKYQILAEKEGYKFSIIEFEAQGTILQSIEIVAQK